MSTRMRLLFASVLIFGLAFYAWAGPENDAIDIRSMGELAFGPDGVLFVGDSAGAAIYALQLGDKEKADAEADPPRITDLDEKLAGLFGVSPRDLLVNDMAVHPTSRNIYLSVSRGRGNDAVPVLMKVNMAGEISEVSLDGVPWQKAAIDNAPAEDAKDRRGRSLRTQTITDITYADGMVFVAGLSNEEFSSQLRQLPYPFKGKSSSSGIEIYHGAHGAFETHAPIRTLMPLELEGKSHLLAAYTCTPLVTIPIADLKDGAKVQGKTVAELGFGNAPLDMVSVEKDGEPLVLITNNRRAGMTLKPADIAGSAAITTEVEGITAGTPFTASPFGGTLHMDNFGKEAVIYIARNLDDGSLILAARSTRWL